jgi:outer membrane protein OmpA-like peptidoglycan-associated protein
MPPQLRLRPYLLHGGALTLLIGIAGCSPKPATTSQASPDAGNAIEIPADVKPEDVARYTLEQMNKRRQANEQPQRSANFPRMMQAALNNGAYADMIAASKRHSLEFPKDGLAPYYQGVALFYDGDLNGAKQAWLKARSLDSKLAARLDPFEARLSRIQKRFPELKLSSIEMVPSDMQREGQVYWDKGKALIQAKNYDEIERVAKQLQNQPAQKDGESPLNDFMGGVCYQDQRKIGSDEEVVWKAAMARLQQWQKARPNSLLCRGAIIETETKWAWSIRGGDYADKVSDEDWVQVNTHLENARVLVRALPPEAFNSPYTCQAVLRWSHLAGVPEPQMRQMWAGFEKRFPDNLNLALQWSLYLLPQWNGKKGEWQKFAHSWANHRKGVAGDTRFAQFLIGHQSRFPRGVMWAKNKALWPRAKRGIEELLKQHPSSISLATALMQTAMDAGDYTTAQNALVYKVKNRASKSRYKSPHEFAQTRINILDPDPRVLLKLSEIGEL